MHRQRNELVAVLAKRAQRAKDGAQRLADVFAPVKGGEDQLFVCRERRDFRIDRLIAGAHFGARKKKSVDHGVAHHKDTIGGNTFTQQIVTGLMRRRKMQRGRMANEAAVEFLRPRRLQVAGAKTGFDMRDGDAIYKPGGRGGGGRRGIALDDDPIVALGAQQLFELLAHQTEFTG